MDMFKNNSLQKAMPFGFSAMVFMAVFIGWRLRDYRLISAENGIGYWLGITGCGMLVLLLVYPMRKRIKALRKIGSVKAWFRSHMLLGVFGPLCILFHSNFHLGSLNSRVALFSMLTVSISGVAGRYFYGKIHHGLYGKKADLSQLRNVLEEEKENLSSQSELLGDVNERLMALSKQVLIPPTTLTGSIRRVVSLHLSAVSIRRKLRREVKINTKLHSEDHKISNLLKAIINVAEYSCYERLFSLWHVLHIPLFFIMLITIVVHIVAVHQY